MLFFRKKICPALLAASILLTGCAADFSSDKKTSYKINSTQEFEITDASVINPYIGFAHDASDITAVGDNSLVYIDVTFRELQPDNPEAYAFAAIDASNNVALWKEQGKHAVLRFICDSPSSEAHSDIPDWLMKLTGDGTAYSTSVGKGYSPDYSNETFIKHHKQAISALAKHFDDGFVSYVQLGSLGHWGEWQVTNNEGVINIPSVDVRQRYIAHYVQEFSNAKLLMPEPFSHAKGYHTGLYNNAIGSAADTEEWLDHIEYGGIYDQTDEEKALLPMTDFWKTAPAGGELTGAVSMYDICTTQLDATVDLIKKSHLSFMGPNTPFNAASAEQEFQPAIDAFRTAMGYRFGITKVSVLQQENFEHIEVKLEWENAGSAPVYFELPVALYVRKETGEFEKTADVNIELSELMPGETATTTTIIPESATQNADGIYIGITDAATETVSVKLVSNQNVVDNYTEIYKLK